MRAKSRPTHLLVCPSSSIFMVLKFVAPRRMHMVNTLLASAAASLARKASTCRTAIEHNSAGQKMSLCCALPTDCAA